jgi:polyisoprenyl-phosphate glycosyltransferase
VKHWSSKKYISIVIPVYMGEGILFELIERLKKNILLITKDFEIILIDDASPDNSAVEIGELKKQNANIISLHHEKNIGQHSSILHGLQMCNGEWIVIMDCDMQDLPEEIPNLFTHTNTNEKIILAERKKKQFSFAKKIYSNGLNFILRVVSAKKYSSSTGNFGVYHHDVIEKIKNIPAGRFYFPAAIRNSGFAITVKIVQHGERKTGRSSYHIFSLLKLSFTAIRASLYKIKTISV